MTTSASAATTSSDAARPRGPGILADAAGAALPRSAGAPRSDPRCALRLDRRLHPIQGCGASAFVSAEGFVERPEDRRYTALSVVAPKYFQTLGIPLLAGREFVAADESGPLVAIVSEGFARHYFPRGDALGKRVDINRATSTGRGWGGQPYKIVGIAGDAKSTELREPAPRTMYLSMFQDGRVSHQFSLRTTGNPYSIAATARRAVNEVLKTVPVTRITTLSDQVDAAIVPERLIATLSQFFGALGAVLAGVGLYGLLAYAVARRINEIGIRMALGATARNVRLLVLRDALATTGAGILFGSAMVLWARPLATALLTDLKIDSLTPLAVGAAAILSIALIASYIPVRRAARVDPMVALRHE